MAEVPIPVEEPFPTTLPPNGSAVTFANVIPVAEPVVVNLTESPLCAVEV